MGEVSKITGGISSTISNVPIVGKPIANALNSVGNLASGGFNANIIPDVTYAPQGAVNQQIANQDALKQQFLANAAKYGLSADQALQQYNQYAQQAQQGIQQAQSANTNVGGDALGILRGAATGEAPSAAQAQLRSGLDNAIASQSALANSGPANSQVAAQRNAAEQSAKMFQEAANSSAQLRANEMATARGQYGTQATSFANQASTNAGLQTGLAAQQAGVYGTDVSAQNAANSNAQAAGATAASTALGQMTANTSAENARQDAIGKAIGGGLGGAGTALASDKNLKKNIKDVDMKEFLNSLEAKEFEYKDSDGEFGKTPGKHLGILAQDLEKTPEGESMILEHEEGKHIDSASSIGTLFASAAHLNKRLSEIEELFEHLSKKKK